MMTYNIHFQNQYFLVSEVQPLENSKCQTIWFSAELPENTGLNSLWQGYDGCRDNQCMFGRKS